MPRKPILDRSGPAPACPPGVVAIPLGKGNFTFVDSGMAEEVSKSKWIRLACGYAGKTTRRGGKNGIIYLHRVLCGLDQDDERVVDHIDGNPLNNVRSNLSVVSRSLNLLNRRSGVVPKSGFRGVHLHAETGRWRAQATLRKKRVSLGLFDTPEEAAKAYDLFVLAAYKHAKVNFPARTV